MVNVILDLWLYCIKKIGLFYFIHMLIYFKYINSYHLNMFTFIHYVHILIGKGRVQNISRELDTIKFFKHPPYNLSHNLILSRISGHFWGVLLRTRQKDNVSHRPACSSLIGSGFYVMLLDLYQGKFCKHLIKTNQTLPSYDTRQCILRGLMYVCRKLQKTCVVTKHRLWNQEY